MAIWHDDQATFDKVHVTLSQKLARDYRASCVVYISAIGADPQNLESAPCMYLRSKRQVEVALLQATGMPLQAAQRLCEVAKKVAIHADTRFQPARGNDVAIVIVRSLAQWDTEVMSPATRRYSR